MQGKRETNQFSTQEIAKAEENNHPMTDKKRIDVMNRIQSEVLSRAPYAFFGLTAVALFRMFAG